MKIINLKPGREARLLATLTALFGITLLSGLYSLFRMHSTDSQWNIIGHVGMGIATALLAAPYLLAHFRRTIGTRKPLILLSGILAVLITFSLFGSGIWIAWVGQTETSGWVVKLHLFGALTVVAIIALHLILHRVLRYSDRPLDRAPKTYNGSVLGIFVAACAGYAVLLAFASFAYDATKVALAPSELTKTYEYKYGPHPFRPSQTETSTGTFIHEKQIARSEFCADCHTDIAIQWRSSMHRKAALDPTYVKNITLLEAKKGISATRYCEGCHAPIALLVGDLTPGGQHGGIEGTVANAEGISCLSCHSIAETTHLNGVASFIFEPASEYLFSNNDAAALTAVTKFLIKNYPSQHKRDMAQPVLKEPRYCATCHAQFMDADMNDWGWVKMQDDYSAWQNSPYSLQHQHQFSEARMVRCQDCHMPLVKAKDPSADENGMIRSHRFAAANTMVPFLSGDEEQLNETKKFLQSNKMRVTIEKPNRKNAVQSKLHINEDLRDHKETPYYHYTGEEIELSIAVSNVGVGHDFPGGTADINEPWLELLITDSSARQVFHSGYLLEDGSLEPGAHAYVSKPIDRNGNLVWKHDLFNRVGEAYKNVIEAGQTDVVTYRFVVPSWAKTPLVATARLRYRKLNTRYAKWALEDQYRPLPIVDMARDTLLIEILPEKSVFTD